MASQLAAAATLVKLSGNAASKTTVTGKMLLQIQSIILKHCHEEGRYNAAPSPRTKLGRLTGPIARYLDIELEGGERAYRPTISATVVVLFGTFSKRNVTSYCDLVRHH